MEQDNHRYFPVGASVTSILDREKDIGQTIGLAHLETLLFQRKHELEIRLGLIKDEPIEEEQQ